MIVSHELLLTLQELRGFGPKKIETTVLSMDEIASDSTSLKDLALLIKDLHKNGRLKGLSSLPDLEDIEKANKRAAQIIRRSEDLGIKITSRYDDDFPLNLLNTVNEKGKLDIPVLLFYRGNLAITQKPAIAIIGTREPSPHGILAGEKYGEFFAERGFNIVSGLALGCDTAGHKGALRSQNGVTTAFLAHGLDTIYPPENKTLADEIIAKGGLLMTEYAVGERVNRNYLVNRDRLQAAMADATLVIQTGIKGGTMHAVNATLAAQKTLYAVEYKVSIPDECDSGNRWLINSGKAQAMRSENQEYILNSILKSKNTVLSTNNKVETTDTLPRDKDFPQGTLFNN